MIDDSNTFNENENKDNTHNTGIPVSEPNTETTKDDKLLNFLSGSEKEEENEESEEKTNDNKDNKDNKENKESKDNKDNKENRDNRDNNMENIIPDINENLKGEIKKDNDEKDNENNANENNQSKSSVQEEKKKVYITLDYLFNFLSNNGPLNFVLCGYFQKVFNHLANYKNACVINNIINSLCDIY
jgi:hypothetical protein